MTIFEDNQAAMVLAKDFVCSRKTKHMDIKFHYVREQINKKNIILKYCNTANMVADVLTKGLNHEKFINARKMLGVTKLN